MSRRLLILLCLVGFVTSGIVFAQDAFPPLAPPVDESDDIEVLNKGAIHEAFAAPVDHDPVVGPPIKKEPPQDLDEVPPEVQPDGQNVVWIGGYWSYDEDLDDFIWISGLWRDVPPGRTWIPGYWASSDEGFQWISGIWTDEQAEQLAYLPEPPPSQENGPSSPAPSETHFWIPGSWVYDADDYRWRAGYWAPYQENWVWIPGQYTYTPRGYIYVAGYWDYDLSDRGIVYAPIRCYNNYRPTRYRPSVVISSWDNLILHLFVSPRRGHYVFGDYYADRYNNRYVPFYAYHRDRRGYDPIYAHFHVRFGNDGYNRLTGWNRYFHNHEEHRPRGSYIAQRNFLQKNRNNQIIAVGTLSENLDSMRQRNKNSRTFYKLDSQAENRFVDSTKKRNDFNRLRRSFESGGAVKGGKIEKPTTQKIDLSKLRDRSNNNQNRNNRRVTVPDGLTNGRGFTGRDDRNNNERDNRFRIQPDGRNSSNRGQSESPLNRFRPQTNDPSNNQPRTQTPGNRFERKTETPSNNYRRTIPNPRNNTPSTKQPQQPRTQQPTVPRTRQPSNQPKFEFKRPESKSNSNRSRGPSFKQPQQKSPAPRSNNQNRGNSFKSNNRKRSKRGD